MKLSYLLPVLLVVVLLTSCEKDENQNEKKYLISSITGYRNDGSINHQVKYAYSKGNTISSIEYIEGEESYHNTYKYYYESGRLTMRVAYSNISHVYYDTVDYTYNNTGDICYETKRTGSANDNREIRYKNGKVTMLIKGYDTTSFEYDAIGNIIKQSRVSYYENDNRNLTYKYGEKNGCYKNADPKTIFLLFGMYEISEVYAVNNCISVIEYVPSINKSFTYFAENKEFNVDGYPTSIFYSKYYIDMVIEYIEQ